MTVFESIKKVVEILEGAYSFVLISILDPEAMYVVKNTGTMVIGFPPGLKSSGDDVKSLKSLSDHGSDDEESKGTNSEKTRKKHKF